MAHTYKILIVDDDCQVCDSLKALLSTQGYEIMRCENGRDALGYLSEHTVDLVLMDIVMERMDGFQVMEKMAYRHQDIPVILMTGHSSTDSAVEALRKGAYDYLRKPFEPAELLTSVKNALDQKTLKENYHSLYSMMRLLCDNVPDMIWAKDLEKRFVFVNKAMCKNLLNAADTTEPIGKTDMFFADRERAGHPDDPQWHTFGEICRDSDLIVMAEGKPQRFDEFGNVQGKFLFLEVHKAPFLDQNGRMIGTVGSARDVTEARELEERLMESEERFRHLLQYVPAIAVQGYRLDGTTTYWNQASERLYGYSAQEAIGRNLLDLIIPPEMRSEVAASMEEMLRTGRPIASAELFLMRRDGSRVPVFSNHALVRLPGGSPELFCLDIDLTERKRAEEQREKLEAENRQLQKAESLNRMAGAIAHHFNNQLASVIGNLELALDISPGDHTPLDNLGEAIKAARKAAEVSGLMLTYLGQTSSMLTPIDISEVCNRSLPLLRAVLPKRILLETHLAMPGPVIKGNATQIQQILTHLITNAQEAVGDGPGAVELSVRTVLENELPATHRFPIDWQPRDQMYACLEVADGGCGIAETDIEKIFDPFFTSKFTGRGLGLSVVLGILKAHHGMIAVESKPGGGSIFRVFWPVSCEPPSGSAAIEAKASERAEGGTVLLVEDEEQVRKMVRAMLMRLGYTVFEAKDGMEAAEVFRRKKDEIRWILCDVTMPGMDGWETLAALRKLAPGIRLILYSGYNESQVMTGEHPEQPDAFLHKPFSRKELAAVIRRVLAEK